MKATAPGITLGVLLIAAFASAADTVPPEIQQPGTQPNEVQNFESPNKCDNCHGGYDEAWAYSNEPAFGWRGGAMGNAGRDPIFWATLAIAEQDFDGAGDLCIRCHSTAGWYGGRSTPTDGSGLAVSDDNGVDCDTCHQMTNPSMLEHVGVVASPFEPYDITTGEPYYGSGMLVLWGSSDKLGPYGDADARHQWMQSQFHRSDLCGSCHDVSNPAVGDLAPNNGRQPSGDPVISSGGNLGGPIEDKAAFNNPTYMYGVVERTFSEWKSSALDDMDVRDFTTLPADLQVESGALNMAYQSAMLAGGTYQDGTIRTFSCQSCHMRPDIGEGCNKNVQTRSDLPKHDQSGGNYWMWPLIKYQDQQGTLRLGGGLTATQLAAMDAGEIRAKDQLHMAASLDVNGNDVKITNLTGHKLITGYPEGRRMWLNIKWYDASGTLVHEDGAYGPLPGVTFTNPVDGSTFGPESMLDLEGTNTKIYEAHYALTREWAARLMTVDSAHYGPLVLDYDRTTGSPQYTIADLASGNVPHGTYHDTFHFVLNNYVSKDNRIPPYGMDCEEARRRNALPVPSNQYGGPIVGPGETCGGVIYEYWDMVTLTPPIGAVSADITLYYQGTSWEYILFLWKANHGIDPAQGGNAFLGNEGVNMLDAWLNADPDAPMVPPYPMALATWGTPPCAPDEPGTELTCSDGVDNDCDGLIDEDDPDCVCVASEPGTELTCDDGVDNDCDGLVDGVDPDCACTPDEPGMEISCADGVDNDCDGLIDEADPDCAAMTCSDYTSKGACNDDPACEWIGSPANGFCQDAVGCTPTETTESTCDDGIDNDCDGTIDCADATDCASDPICQTDCSVYTTKNLCNAQPACSWNNKDKVCLSI